MGVFRNFEEHALRILVTPHLGAVAVGAIERDAQLVSYSHSGVGYFLTVRHPEIPAQRIACVKPIVSAYFDATPCGFIAFIQNGQLMLEFYSAGVESIPTNIRDMDVLISTVDYPGADRDE